MPTLIHHGVTTRFSQTMFATIAGLGLLCFLGIASAQAVGEVEFARGVGFLQMAGESPRTLGKGLPLREGDRLTIAEGAVAIVKLQDGTRMTVRRIRKC